MAIEILDTMADALFVIDAEARVRVINDAVHTLFGYTESEILGKTIDTLEYVDLEASISRTLRDMLRRAPIRDEERVFRGKDGARIDVSISVSPLHERDMEGGAVLIARDIRGRKRAEEELRAFTVKLQQSNRELEDFAYVASHDLQEPLRKIQAFGDRLKVRYGEALTGEGVDYLNRMQSAAGRMQRLINDLLLFSRITTKAQPFAPVDLGVIAREVVHDLEARIHDSGGEVVVGELPSIDADAWRCPQAARMETFTSQCRTTASASTKSTPTASSRCSNDCTAAPRTKGPESAWQSAAKSRNATAATSARTVRRAKGHDSWLRCL